jgi:hypothetical protein
VVGLITNNGAWCQENNLTLNVNKTKEMIVDFRKQQREQVDLDFRQISGHIF